MPLFKLACIIMKYLIILIVQLFILTNICFSQCITERHQGVFTQIEEIDKEKGYQVISLENEDFLPEMTDGGGELLGLYKDGNLIKISLKIFLSYGIRKFDYYFSNDDLLYIRERFEQFYYNPQTDVKDYSKTELPSMVNMPLRIQD